MKGYITKHYVTSVESETTLTIEDVAKKINLKLETMGDNVAIFTRILTTTINEKNVLQAQHVYPAVALLTSSIVAISDEGIVMSRVIEISNIADENSLKAEIEDFSKTAHNIAKDF